MSTSGRLALLALAVVTILWPASARSAATWPDGKELTGRLLDLARLDRATVREIGRSAGGQKLRLLDIAPAEPREGGDAAILVLANLEGDLPLCSLAAVELAAEVLAAPGDAPAGAVRWYVAPMANPDGLDRWFARPRAPGGRNDTPVDDDADGLTDEDPPDDLDGDGLITWMLVDDPAGDWALDAGGLPVRADPARGVPGRWRRETEGRDDDGDGRFNEDPPGGVLVARNFPHAFEHWGEAGRWPGDQPETRAILEFAFAHPEIALVLVLGETSNLWTVPDPQAEPDPQRPVQPGWRLARALGLEPGGEYALESVLATAAEVQGRTGLTPEAVKARLHLEPVTRPLPADLAWWRALADAYRAYLADHGLDAPREAPGPPPPGGAAPWAYFQYGVPAVAIDLWSLPAPVDSAAADADTNAAADGAATDGAARGGAATAVPAPRPAGPRPDPVHVRLEERTERAQHLGWRPWQEVTLDDGVTALVGGPVPGATTTPAAYSAPVRARALVPWLLDLAAWLPRLEVDLNHEDRSDGVLAVTAVIRNPGRLPYPTSMGELTGRPAPIVVELAGGEPLDHPGRRTVSQVAAGGAVALHWLVRADDPDALRVTASAPSLGTVTATGGAR